MKLLWILAWRNIWRNKRRTALTAATVTLAVVVSLFMRSMQEGSYDRMIYNSARFYSGYMQIQNEAYWKNKSIDELLPVDEAFISLIEAQDNVNAVLPRLETLVLAARGKRTRGIQLMGVVMTREDTYSDLSNHLLTGRMPRDDEQAVMVGSRLAEYLQLELGDKLVLYGQGYHGNTAAGLADVVGIIKHPNPLLDSQVAYIPLAIAQALFSTGMQVTAIVVNVDSARRVDAVATRVRTLARDHFLSASSVKTWETLTPEIKQGITLDRVSGQLIVAILYGVVGFGIFSTIAVMTLERRRELAVLIANGMNRGRLQIMIMFESLQIGIIGIVLGLTLTTPVLGYLYYNPIPLSGDIKKVIEDLGMEAILPFSMAPSLFYGQSMIILVILILCVQYPLYIVRRLNLAEAIKG